MTEPQMFVQIQAIFRSGYRMHLYVSIDEAKKFITQHHGNMVDEAYVLSIIHDLDGDHWQIRICLTSIPFLTAATLLAGAGDSVATDATPSSTTPKSPPPVPRQMSYHEDTRSQGTRIQDHQSVRPEPAPERCAVLCVSLLNRDSQCRQIRQQPVLRYCVD